MTKELGDFLRSKRDQLRRADLGLPPVSRSRAPGLRREEVAYLAGVSVTWYTWLEQGRDIRPSRQVLDAIARTLRLSAAEHAYVLALVGYAAPIPTDEPTITATPPHLQRLLDALRTFPAFAIAADWGIVAWNTAYAELYPNVATVNDGDRNLLWLVFTDPYVRSLLPDWEVTARRFLAEFRAEAGPRLGEPTFVRLVTRLAAASPEFRAGWANHAIEGFTSRERSFLHPIAGRLILELHRLTPTDHPDLHLIVYTPAPASDAAERLANLLDRTSRDTASTVENPS